MGLLSDKNVPEEHRDRARGTPRAFTTRKANIIERKYSANGDHGLTHH